MTTKILVLCFLGLFSPIFASSLETTKRIELSGFGWKPCDEASHGKITDIQVSPDPVTLPGNILVGIDGTLEKDIVQGSPFSIDIRKKVGPFWVKVPCENGKGSCTYEDFCKKWPIPRPCPEAYKKNGIPCECPLKAGHYKMPLTDLGYLEPKGIPEWLEDGDYKLTARIVDKSDDKPLLCFELDLTLKAK